jgi:hypothetical protein
VQLSAVQCSSDPLPADRSSKNPPPELVRAIYGRRGEDNEFGVTNDQSEWVGDRIVFELKPAQDGTKVALTQHELAAAQDCYDVCSNAQNFFLGDSLRLSQHGHCGGNAQTGWAELRRARGGGPLSPTFPC